MYINLFFLSVLLCLISKADAQLYGLKVLVAPQGCYGGQPCQKQPVVAAYFRKSSQIAYSFIGSAYVVIRNSPTSFEKLYIGDSCNLDSCGSVVSGSIARVPFINGVATFHSLFFTTAGSGYSLNFIGLDSSNNPFAMTYSDSFIVLSGTPYKLILDSFVGTAYGGEKFSANPIVGIVDRGNNIVRTYTNTTITATLVTVPKDLPEAALLPSINTVVSVVNGVASFKSLHIQEAGYPYQIQFSSSDSTFRPIISRKFNVVEGKPVALAYLHNSTKISSSRIYAGEYIVNPPILKLIDSGGNFVYSDNSTGVQLSIAANPTNASISPLKNAFVVANRGIVRFQNIRADKPGLNYTLRFDLFNYSHATNKFYPTNYSFTSEQFSVHLSVPRKLKLIKPADNAWAGSQAFYNQPVILLTDYAENRIIGDSISTNVIRMVESLSTNCEIVIDTSDAPISSFASIEIYPAVGTFGVGELLVFVITSPYTLWVNATDDNFETPYLVLNILKTDGSKAIANLTEPFFSTRNLVFKYIIGEGDSLLSGSQLLFAQSLHSRQYYQIVDGNGNKVNYTLPIHTLDVNITIDTSAPVVTNMYSNTTSGEYGPGQAIELILVMSQPVEVMGRPILMLSLQNNDTASERNGTERAYFTRLSNNGLYLHFVFQVIPNENTYLGGNLTLLYPSIIVQNITWNDTTIALNANNSYVYSYHQQSIIGGWIRRISTNPTAHINYSLPLHVIANFHKVYNIQISAKPPTIDTSYGLQSNVMSGRYYPGDKISVFVRFDKPIAAKGVGIILLLQVDDGSVVNVPISPNGVAFIKRVAQDNKTIEFEYVVEEYTFIRDMDILDGDHSLRVISNDSYLMRAATNPLLHCNLSTLALSNSGNSLRFQKNITLFGYPPTVSNLILKTVIPNSISFSRQIHTLYPGDKIHIAINFSEPVVTTCNAVFVLQLNYQRECSYVSGNNTNQLVFQYMISAGDTATNSFGYRNIPTPICASSGCSKAKNFCGIFASSDNPQMLADLRLPALSSSGAHVVAIGNYSIFPTFPQRKTTIFQITCKQTPGRYGVGSAFYFDVLFTDIIILQTSAPYILPSLLLNNNASATYFSGNYGKVLTFIYVVSSNDSVLLQSLRPTEHSHTVFPCSVNSKCRIINEAGESIDYSLSNANLSSIHGIYLDPSPPRIQNIQLIANAYNFTAGQQITVRIFPNYPVVVGGVSPRIRLRLPNTEAFAVYNRTSSTKMQLNFDYIFQLGDIANNITFVDNSIDLLNGNSQILRDSAIPTTPMNVSFPVRLSYQISEHDIDLDTVEIPQITSVHCLNSSGNFTAGDKLFIQIEYSLPVIVCGHLTLAINAGDHVSFADYVGYKHPNTTALLHWEKSNFLNPSSYTRKIIFEYIVAEDDISLNLEYADHASLTLGLTANHDKSYIKRYIASDAIEANLYLPLPAEGSSISTDGHIRRIDGRAAFLENIKFLNPSGVYSTNSTIVLVLKFSKPVFVYDGVPSIFLETGLVKNEARYYNGSGTSELSFVYSPEPGDVSEDLDYISLREAFGNATSAFNLNGAKILTASTFPVQPAHIRLNPPGGILKGLMKLSAVEGTFLFEDNYITKRGTDYEIFYTANIPYIGTSLYTSQLLPVSFSSEVELRPQAAWMKEMIGYAVDIENDIAVVGAPNFNSSITTIQVLSIVVEHGQAQREIQAISTTILPQPSIQRFHTTAGVGEAIGGYFTVSAGPHGISRLLPATIDAFSMSNFLDFDLEGVGHVNVTVEPYHYCACKNAFIFTLTFEDINIGSFDAVIVDGSLLTGESAAISDVDVLQHPSLLQGSFTLSNARKTTDPIPIDANVAEITEAIISLGYSVHYVAITMETRALTRTWSVVFNEYEFSYEIPILIANKEGLYGGKNPNVFVSITQPGRHGPKGIAGYFQLSWRGNTTVPLSPFTTAHEMKEALEALPIINTVNVNRTLINPDVNSYAWIIEFVSVNYHTSRGYFPEIRQLNVEPIVPINHLIASNSSILVDAKWELGSRNRIYSSARQGTFGEGAGAVFIYQRKNESWLEIATIRGNDTMEANRFGTSVSIDNGVILVGAVGANIDGVPEKQAIHCKATGGEFQLKFRGWITDFIPYNATIDYLILLIRSTSDVLTNLYSVRSITIDGWKNPGGLCNNNTAIITFFSPVYEAHNVPGSNNGSDLELLSFVNVNLSHHSATPLLTIRQVQAGTWKLQGAQSDPQQRGAAYIFRYENNCKEYNRTFCEKAAWKQEAQFFPGGYIPQTRFGESVLLSENTAIIGASEYNGEVGALYIYEYDTVGNYWFFLQKLNDPTPTSGNHFGKAFAKYGTTLAVGSPNFHDNIGGVYIYTRPTSGTVFILAQLLTPSNVVQGSLYGSSISLYQNWIVIGAPGFDAKSVYLGNNSPLQGRTDSGTVYVFRRNTAISNYRFVQNLNPSNVKEYDRFGYKVEIENNLILASAFDNYEDTVQPSKVVIQIQTRAVYEHTKIGGFFRILWKATNYSAPNPSFGFQTRLIRYDTSAIRMKAILEEDLRTGELIVSRSRVDIYDGGYEWLVTFMRYRGEVTLFESDTAFLTGTNVSVNINFAVGNPSKTRGKVHLFQLDTNTNKFVEQLFLTPLVYQPIDRCGHSIGLSGSYAIVGCPNRDRDIPQLNSGAAFIYDLNLLNVKYSVSTQTHSVVEGETATIAMSYDWTSPIAANNRDIYFYIQTLDRNANLSVQNFFADMYAVQDNLYHPETVLDHIQLVGNATARSQFYGSTQRFSRWVDGRYDYRAIADYVQIKQPLVLLNEYPTVNLKISTNPDSIIEFPFETIQSAIHIPGLWPSIFSKFYFTTILKDDWTNYPLDKARYRKFVDTSTALDSEQLGHSCAIKEDYGVLFIGAPHATLNNIVDAGRSLQYNFVNKTWSFESVLRSPSWQINAEGGRFGAGMGFDHSSKRRLAVLAISEPEFAKVHIFIAYHSNYYKKKFLFDTTLSVDEAYLPLHQFGEANAIAVNGHLVAIGAAGLETVYLFRHLYNATSDLWYWSSSQPIRSSDYDYDVINSVVFLHKQQFGKSVSISGRTLVVGAPYADYANSATNLTETYHTDGMNIFAVGRGKAYIFYSKPAKSSVCLTSAQPLKEGTFVLEYNHYNSTSTSLPIRFNGSDTDLLFALDSLNNVDQLSVSKQTFYIPHGEGDVAYCWDIVFNSEWSDIGELTARWYGSSCNNCTQFDYPVANHTTNITGQVQVKAIDPFYSMEQVKVITAPDSRQGDRFGFSVSVDRDYIIVGAPYSSAAATTTWDFEVGFLSGWSKTGNAFDFQPTFGDNSKYRLNSQISSHLLKHYQNYKSSSSNMKGRYYVSTFEKHPGSQEDITQPDDSYSFGNIQGNEPTGSLTSDVFMILGDRIKFLIGGGCNINSVFVELLIDGKGVAKHTGKCSDAMESVEFAVDSFIGRAAIIRIVDNSTSSFIAIDNIQFSWDIHGAATVGLNEEILNFGSYETLYSGAAYLFRRIGAGGISFPCLSSSQEQCEWIHESKFLPSDKRENAQFGTFVAINGMNGIAAVGAPFAELTGNYKDTYSTYPYSTFEGNSLGGGLQFPVDSHLHRLFEGSPHSSVESSGSSGVNLLLAQKNVTQNLLFSRSMGAVYFFRKQFPVWSYNQEIGTLESWSSNEIAKIQSLDAQGEDNFGKSIFMDGHSIIIGAPGVDVVGVNSGAVYYYNTQFASVKFSEALFHGIEGRDAFITFTVLRDLQIYDGELILEFATSDLTAKGVDSNHYRFCMNQTAVERHMLGCGDYEQRVGIIVFPAGVSSSGFTVNVIDDNCYERDMKYIQLSLSVPGAGPLQGEGFDAMIRIDDDDYGKNSQLYCT